MQTFCSESIGMQKDAGELAYIIYTSGTTGRPKGVMISHRSALELINWSKKEFDDSAIDVVYAATSHCFDLSIFEMFYTFSIGKRIRILENALDIGAYISSDKNVLINTVPSAMRNILAGKHDLRNVNMINLAGEVFPVDLANNLLPYNIELRNLYGPSEDTTYSTVYQLKQKEYKFIPIGKPIANTKVYVLDKNLQLLPVGVTGKLFVSGLGLAKGYLNRPELTKERFINNPYAYGEKMYDTGDLARWLPDGNIEFLGRMDHQVKLRGFRIELGEIENTIQQFSDDIQQVVVDVKEVQNEKTLVAYIISFGSLDDKVIRDYVMNQLPHYMVPSSIMQMEKIPLTPNGKIDRNALPTPGSSNVTKREFEGPRNSVEKTLVEIWQEVLQINDIGINDNFFNLGGHSLMISQIINRIYKQLSRTIPFRTFFNHPTIASLSREFQKLDFSPIAIASSMPSYPVTDAQRRLWVLGQMDGGLDAYQIAGAIELEGDVIINHFEQAFSQIVLRHESLRSYFKLNEQGDLNQYILPIEDLKLGLIYKDFSAEVSPEKSVKDYINDYKFLDDLSKAPLFHAAILKKTHTKFVLFLKMHHIISDGWSIEILISELVQLYNGLLEEEEISLPPLPIQYKDYAVWQTSEDREKDQEKSRKYWLDQLKGALPVLELPTYQKRPLVKSYNGSSVVHHYSESFLETIKRYAQQADATLFMTLMAGVNALLYRYTNQKEIIVGTPVAGRSHPDLEHQIGLYLNTLAIRTKLEQDQTFKALLAQEKATLLSAYEHQDYPFDALVNELNIKRDPSRSAIFDVMVVLQNQSQLRNLNKEGKLKGLEVSPYELPHQTAQFDMRLTFEEREGLSLEIEYNSDIYDVEWVNRMFLHFEKLISQLIGNPEKEISTLNYLSEAEYDQLVRVNNATEISYPEGVTVLNLFEDQVSQGADRVIAVYGEETLTIGALDKYSNAVANDLLSKGLEEETLVPICVDRSLEMLIGILGILKSGGAYVPIDPKMPQQRIDYILEDINAKWILTNNIYEDRFSGLECVNLEELPKEGISFEAPKVKPKTNQLAYAIYTSGTTGRPKGVLNEHKGLYNRLLWMRDDLQISNESILLQKTPYTFDVSVWELIMPLITGSKLIFAKPEGHKDPIYLQEVIRKEQVSVIHFVPSMLGSFLEELDAKKCKSLEDVVCSGEALPASMVEKFKQQLKGLQIHNLYGPTEAAIDVSSIALREEDTRKRVSIGRPVANTQLYVVNERMKPQAEGVIGELLIGGVQVARGYLNRGGLTAEKFIKDPFKGRGKVYRTGDLVRWLKEGTIEYIGRTDHQVKIRGNRIELGEIEHRLLQYSGDLTQTVVVPKKVKGGIVLVGYYSTKASIEKGGLRAYLSSYLPDYMVPGYLVELEEMPLSVNGKINRKGLPEIESKDLIKQEYEGPRTEEEKTLVKIWEEVLDVDKIGIKDNFFELGGHSLMVSQVINRVQRMMGKTLSFQSFFSNPTIEGLSNQLEGGVYEGIPKAPLSKWYPMTATQSRLWVLSQLEGGSLAYNIPTAIRLKGRIDEAKFAESFNRLIERHESLRTSFGPDGSGNIGQYISSLEDSTLVLEQLDYRGQADKAEKINEYLKKQQEEAFELDQAPLLRGGLIRTGEEESLFYATMHHIISDGWSIEILISELVQLYNGLLEEEEISLPPLPIQYKDYAVWQTSEDREKDQEKSRKYWLDQLKGALPVLELPTYQKRPLVKSYNGSSVVHHYSESFLETIKRYAQQADATLFMTLMAGVNALLYRYTNQKEIIVGTPVAGRSHPDLEHQIGLYLNTLAIRTKLEQDQTFKALLAQEKATLLSAYEHQDYPFDALVNELNIKRDPSRSAIFDVMVVLQNQSQLRNLNKEGKLKGLEVSPYELPHQTAQFDLTFTFMEQDGLTLEVEYNTDLYESSFVERMGFHLEEVLKELINNADKPIKAINYLTKAEQEQLLNEFNDTDKDYATNTSLIELFEKQVNLTPEKTALVYDNKSISYQELNEEANKLAHYLRKNYSIQSNDVIAIKLDRSEKQIISIIGVLKAGAAYLPVDINFPEDRINYMKNDSDFKLLLDSTTFDQIQLNNREEDIEDIHRENKITDLVYVMYTSGTTGYPKGVMVEERSILNLINWFTEKFSIDSNTVSIQLTNYTFDPSIEEIFGTLCNGGTHHIIPKELILNTDKLRNYIIQHGITILNYVPVLLNELLSDKPKINTLKTVISGGEKLPEHVKNSILLAGYELYNNYGPTEITVDALCGEMTESGGIHIGKPISNVKAYILDEFEQLVPIGVHGQLYISGAGLARGYLNKTDLNSQKFVLNPFLPNQQMYDTGDICAWLPDGTIKYVGRKDHQVKINGYRIELGEIENIFLKKNAIKEVVVTVKEGIRSSEKELVAYYTATDQQNVTEIIAHLKTYLPVYMLPSFYVQLPSIPKNNNGKIDFKSLPDPLEVGTSGRVPYIAPQNDIQTKLIKVWEEVLGQKKIGIKDDFFELGGHSIKATKVLAKVNNEFELDISVKNLFISPTIEDLAAHINFLVKQKNVRLEKTDLKEIAI